MDWVSECNLLGNSTTLLVNQNIFTHSVIVLRMKRRPEATLTMRPKRWGKRAWTAQQPLRQRRHPQQRSQLSPLGEDPLVPPATAS